MFVMYYTWCTQYMLHYNGVYNATHAYAQSPY